MPPRDFTPRRSAPVSQVERRSSPAGRRARSPPCDSSRWAVECPDRVVICRRSSPGRSGWLGEVPPRRTMLRLIVSAADIAAFSPARPFRWGDDICRLRARSFGPCDLGTVYSPRQQVGRERYTPPPCHPIRESAQGQGQGLKDETKVPGPGRNLSSGVTGARGSPSDRCDRSWCSFRLAGDDHE